MKAKKVYEMLDPYASEETDIGIDASYKNELNKKYIEWFEDMSPDTEYEFKDGRFIVKGTLSCMEPIEIPAGIKITTGGDCEFKKISSIPEGFDVSVGGYLLLNNVIHINKNVKLISNETIDLDRLRTMDDNITIHSNFNVWLSKLKEIPKDLDIEVANNLYLTSLYKIPKWFGKKVLGRIFLKNGKTIFPLIHPDDD